MMGKFLREFGVCSLESGNVCETADHSLLEKSKVRSLFGTFHGKVRGKGPAIKCLYIIL